MFFKKKKEKDVHLESALNLAGSVGLEKDALLIDILTDGYKNGIKNHDDELCIEKSLRLLYGLNPNFQRSGLQTLFRTFKAHDEEQIQQAVALREYIQDQVDLCENTIDGMWTDKSGVFSISFVNEDNPDKKIKNNQVANTLRELTQFISNEEKQKTEINYSNLDFALETIKRNNTPATLRRILTYYQVVNSTGDKDALEDALLLCKQAKTSDIFVKEISDLIKEQGLFTVQDAIALRNYGSPVIDISIGGLSGVIKEYGLENVTAVFDAIVNKEYSKEKDRWRTDDDEKGLHKLVEYYANKKDKSVINKSIDLLKSRPLKRKFKQNLENVVTVADSIDKWGYDSVKTWLSLADNVKNYNGNVEGKKLGSYIENAIKDGVNGTNFLTKAKLTSEGLGMISLITAMSANAAIYAIGTVCSNVSDSTYLSFLLTTVPMMLAGMLFMEVPSNKSDNSYGSNFFKFDKKGERK